MQTVLAFDYGTQKTGLAIGNTLTYLARPLHTLTHEPLKPDMNEIAAIIKEWQPQIILVGLPINLDGTESDFCRSCRKFAARLKHNFHLPAYFYNEQLSSQEAENQLRQGDSFWGKGSQSKVKNFQKRKNQQKRDQVAAQIILQRYLDDLSLGQDHTIK